MWKGSVGAVLINFCRHMIDDMAFFAPCARDLLKTGIDVRRLVGVSGATELIKREPGLLEMCFMFTLRCRQAIDIHI